MGGSGIIAVFKAQKKAAKRILFRAELDAIAVEENTGAEHQSRNKGVMHGCGHDGHMAILIGLARKLKRGRLADVDVALLFQPAEETGEGARKVLDDPEFKSLNPDHAFALHNLPGFPENSLLLRDGPFASASVGIEITFKGASSHAAYPEQGVNPAFALAGMVRDLQETGDSMHKNDASCKLAVTFIKMGEKAFGISPGKAQMGCTLRASTDEKLEEFVKKTEAVILEYSGTFGGGISYRQIEPFAATINDEKGNGIVKKAAGLQKMRWKKLDAPFPWSEDFGVFREACPITLIGLGAGKNAEPLHSEKYDFNDNLISTGVELFWEILNHE